MLSAMARFDARDPFCLPDDPRDWRDGIEDGVAGMRIAVLRGPGFDAPADAAAVGALEAAAALLAEAGAEIEEADPQLPDTRAIFGRVWGVALARLVESMPEDKRGLLDPGLLEVARSEGGMTATEFLGAEALRIHAAHTMAMLHRRYDLVLCPTVPEPALPIEDGTGDARTALWTRWAPWTFTFNLTRQPAITVPVGLDEQGLPRSVQIAAAIYRDDLVLRAARVIETAFPIEAAPAE